MTEVNRCPHCVRLKLTHQFQDVTYGEFKRVMNMSQKTRDVLRCTVCNNKSTRLELK